MSENRRVRITKKMIKDAYLELLENNPSEKISVTNICKAADVNRSTFYAYYEDTVVLRRDIENDVLEQIPILSDMPETITSDKQFVDILEQFFAYIQKNQRMFRILILQSDNRRFNRRLIETVLKKYHVESLIKNSLLAEYQYVFIVSGVIGVLGVWIEGGFPINARQISEFVLQMAVSIDVVNDG
ncbi:MAG: TetR/AcrR family transcriptional regulator [Roseburia sp.]|nr:TetR/AcrR family transcriptional regulator [Roseburia sp.]